MNTSTHFIINAGGQLHGTYRVPGDKSISHRAIMLGAIAEGITQISGFLEGEDTFATMSAFRALGVRIEGPTQGQVTVHGVGKQGLQPPKSPLYLGNSGTSMRLLAGLCAGQKFTVELQGDESLSKRPMRRIIEPLTLMGAHISGNYQDTPPLTICGNPKLQGIHYTLPVASAQVKSCVLLAGLYAQGTTCVVEPTPTRDHTERMLQGFNYPLQREKQQIYLTSAHALHATTIEVPADISSATFFIIGATIAPGSDILLEHVGINPTRTGVIEILQQMGADITLLNYREIGYEPVVDIRVRYSPLHGIHIPSALVPLAIDEFPALFIAAACAQGETVLKDAEELRVKESDRIQVMAEGLQILGIRAQPTADGLIIQGGTFQGGVVNSHGDHRVAMAFAMAALRAKNTLVIENCANVATSFPNFIDLTRQAGLRFQ
jgi:3-phosphoshikimate 1-carboxyvinyltransferase